MEEGYTLLHHACSIGNIQIIKTLLSHGVGPTIKNDYDVTAFYYASSIEGLEDVEFLMDE